MTKDDDSIAEFMLEMAKHQGGISCTTVTDGHVLIFSEQALLNLLAKASESDKKQVVIFIKRNDAGLA